MWIKRFAVLFAGFVCSAGLAAVNYEPAIRTLSNLAESEAREGRISGVTVALVDDQQIVFLRGFGLANRKRHVPARVDTAYRAGSISKLFTAMATMQLAEQGRLDIDAPIANYLPDFRIIVPFENAKPITLRQLMCHRAG